jgi:hypothetical protein
MLTRLKTKGRIRAGYGCPESDAEVGRHRMRKNQVQDTHASPRLNTSTAITAKNQNSLTRRKPLPDNAMTSSRDDAGKIS